MLARDDCEILMWNKAIDTTALEYVRLSPTKKHAHHVVSDAGVRQTERYDLSALQCHIFIMPGRGATLSFFATL